MTYGQRVVALLVTFFIGVLGVNIYMVVVATQWASDDMRVGHGHSKFPPQAPRASVSPAPEGGHP